MKMINYVIAILLAATFAFAAAPTETFYQYAISKSQSNKTQLNKIFLLGTQNGIVVQHAYSSGMIDKQAIHKTDLLTAPDSNKEQLNGISIIGLQNGNVVQHKYENNTVKVSGFANLSSAKVYAESVSKALEISTPVTYNNLTINTDVVVNEGGKLTANGSSILNINGSFTAGLFQCLDAGVKFKKGSIESFKADWNGGDIKAAFGSYHIVELSDKTYTLNNVQIFLASTDNNLTYQLKGKGNGSIVNLNNYTSGYVFYLNESSPGVKALNFPTHPRFVMSNVFINAAGSTSASFMWFNEASPQFERVHFSQLLNGTNGTGYTDRVSFQHVKWTQPRTGGWFHQQIEGDTLLAEDVFTGGTIAGTNAQLFYLKRVLGAQLTTLNGGVNRFEESTVNISGSHFENADIDANIRIKNSTVHVSGCNFNTGFAAGNIPGYSPITIDDDSSIDRLTMVTLDSLAFTRYMHTSTNGFLANDIYVNNMRLGGRIKTSNLVSAGWLNTASSTWPRIPYKTLSYGVSIGAADSGLNAALIKAWPNLSKNAEIIYGNGSWFVTSTQQPIGLTALVKPSISITEASTSDLASSFAIGSSVYYTAYQTDIAGRTTEGAVEVAHTISTNGAMKLVISGMTPFVKLTILRGDSTGNYNRKWEFIPLSDTQTFYDDKWLMNGILTNATGSPFTAPSVNTTSNAVLMPTGNIIASDGITVKSTVSIGAATFTGTGLNNLTSGGVYTGTASSETFTVVINQVNALYGNPSITANGSGYTVGDVLTITTGNGVATVQVASINGSGGVTSLLLITAGNSYSVGAGQAVTGGTGTGCTVNITSLADLIWWKIGAGAWTQTYTGTFARLLADGVTIQFGTLAGHTIGDQWTINVTSSNPFSVKTSNNSNLFSVSSSGVITMAGSDGYLKLLSGVLTPTASPVGGVIAQSAVQHTISYAVNGTTQTTFTTITVPAGVMTANSSLRIRAQYSFSNNSNSKIVRTVFGGTTYTQVSITTSNYTGTNTIITNRNSTSSQFGAPTTLSSPDGTSGASPVTTSIDTTAAVNITLTGQCAATGDTITLENYVVELLAP